MAGEHGRTLRLGRLSFLLAVALVVIGVVATLVALPATRSVDLEVYRTAGRVWRAGRSLYDPAYPHGLGVQLPFTYPPFAAVVLGGLSLLPSPAALALLSVLGLGLLAGSMALAWRATGLRLGGRAAPLLVATIGAVAAFTEPVQQTLAFGQVNLVLLGLVTVDLLAARTRLPRGLLIGLAAAVKLTPMAFVLVLLCRREWRAATTAVVAFVAAGVVGALVLPGDSRDFWLGGVLTDAARVGGLDTASNQSLRGVLARLGLVDATGLWLALCLVVVVLTARGTWRRVGHDDHLGALLTTAAGALLVSPISWSHHWVWCAPGLVWLTAWATRRHTATGWSLVVGFAAASVVGPYRFFPSLAHRELQWTWWQQVVGDAYAWVAIGVIVVAAWGSGRPGRSEAGSPRPSASAAPTR